MFDSSPAERARPRWLVPTVVLGVLVVAGGGTAAAGGFAAAPQQPEKPAGKAIDQGAFEVTVRDARITTYQKQRVVAVRMRVAGKGRESLSLSFGGFQQGVVARTAAGKWVKPDNVIGSAAGSETYDVHPGLPVEATALWKAGPADAPARFVVGLRKWAYEPGFTDSAVRWRTEPDDKKLAARVSLAVSPA